MTNQQQQINKEINAACNKLFELTFSDKLHKDFDMRFSISTYALYVNKYIGDTCLPTSSTIITPKSPDEVEGFHKQVDDFIAQVIRDFSK